MLLCKSVRSGRYILYRTPDYECSLPGVQPTFYYSKSGSICIELPSGKHFPEVNSSECGVRCPFTEHAINKGTM